MNALQAQWRQLEGRFNALSRRERAMVAGAVLVVLLFGGNALLLSPRLTQSRHIEAQLQQQRGELSSLQGQVAALRQSKVDPDAAHKAELKQLRTDLAEVDQRLQQLENNLVPPRDVPRLLESMLGRSKGLRLVSLKTLPVSGVIERKAPATTEAAKSAGGAASPEATPVEGANIFKHGVEITIEGGYGELMAFLAEVERAPQHLLWGRLHFDVDQYPKTVMTVTVYTLSLDKQWLTV